MARCRQESDHTGSLEAAIFDRLKGDFLVGEYQPELYDLAHTIIHGDYNCLTATLLFQVFSAEFSLSAQALWEPSHVRCWVPKGDGRGIAVETTAATAEEAIGSRLLLEDLTDGVEDIDEIDIDAAVAAAASRLAPLH